MSLTFGVKLLSVLMAALMPATLVVLAQDPPPHEEGCSGCEADQKVTLYKRTAPNGVAIWEGGAGSLDVSAPANVKDKDGRCKRKRDDEGGLLRECLPDADHPCESAAEITVNNAAGMTYVDGTAFSCVTWAAATADNKKLEASVTACNTESSDNFYAHNNNSSCNVVLGSQRAELKVWCTACKYKAP